MRTPGKLARPLSMDLFSQVEHNSSEGKPLAERLRPKSFDQLILTSAERQQVGLVLKRVEKSGRIPNLLLWGPPGSGKTTLARLVSEKVEAPFLEVNAVDTGAKRLKEIGEESKSSAVYARAKTVLFVDEIHRLNRAQQDVLLPYTETGALSLVGATTENPAHAMNAALLSRCMVVSLKKKGAAELSKALDDLISNGDLPSVARLNESLRNELLLWAGGDFRTLWNLCDQIESSYSPEEIEEDTLSELSQLVVRPPQAVGKQTSAFYNLLSAMIKSIRGTDPDAAIYYMTCLLEGGEDLRVVGRRLVVSASEDIGNANPQALQVAVAGYQAADSVGMPEAAINLAQVVTYLASSPKSNQSYRALRSAQAHLKSHGLHDPPDDLISQASHANSKTYKSPHNTEAGYVPRSHLPKEISSQRFYLPSKHGAESDIRDHLQTLDPKKFGQE